MASFFGVRRCSGLICQQDEGDRLNFLTNSNIHRKSTHTSLKILDFEKKRCSKLHFAEAQPQLVLNLLLTFDKILGSRSYKIVLINKCPFSIKRLRVFFQCKIFCL